MNRKKLISVGLTAAMLTGLLAGCGDSSQNSSQNGSGSEPVVLQWWGSFPENMGPNQVCEAFNKIDPNLQVEYTRFVNDDAGNTKLDVSLMSDSSIDVFLSLNDVLLNKRIDSGYAEPLDELFDKVGFNIKDDYDDAIEQRQKDGHYYSLPAKKMTSTILYNKDMFDKAGVTEVPTSLEGIAEVADDLVNKGGAGEALSMGIYGWFFEEFMCKQGLPYVDNGNGREAAATKVAFDENGGALNILNEWKKLYDAGYAPNVGRGGDSGLADFSSGKAAMTLGSTASLKQILQDVNGSFEVGTAYFPSITDDDKGGVSIGGASLWMLDNQDDAKKAATWEFVKYLVSAESQAYWNAQTGYFPVTTAAHDEQVFKDNIAKYPQFQTAIDQLHDSAPEYAGALLSVFPEARAIVETEIENMLNGKESAEDAVSKMASDMNKSIEDYNLLNE